MSQSCQPTWDQPAGMRMVAMQHASASWERKQHTAAVTTCGLWLGGAHAAGVLECQPGSVQMRADMWRLYNQACFLS
jgi:hypothetical protein